MTLLSGVYRLRVGDWRVVFTSTPGQREGTVDTLRNLSQALGITIDDFVG